MNTCVGTTIVSNVRTTGYALNAVRVQNLLMVVASGHVMQGFTEVRIIQTVAAMSATAIAIHALRNLISALHVMR